MDPKPTKTILILSASPKDKRWLRSDEEIRIIKETIQHSKYRENFRVEESLATPVADLQTTLREYKPHIVHFCGHGEANGLLFEDERGKAQRVPVDALAKLFELCGKSIECVVLNACYSESQANAISQHIPCVVGMNAQIGDKAAIQFAAGFYTVIGDGDYYREAFEFGCNRMGLQNIPEDSTPVIIERRDRQILLEEESDYKWDVFLSYEPVKIFDEWREEIFLQLFEELLRQRFLRPVKIFDRKEFYTGEDVYSHVKNTLAYSRCFVGICSPTYFNCYQCRYELSVMLKRERRLGYRTAANPNYLILIAKIWDGDQFPNHVMSMGNNWDFNGLTSPGIRYGRKSEILDEKIDQLVTATEKAINSSPPWNNTLLDDFEPDEELIDALQPVSKFLIPRY